MKLSKFIDLNRVEFQITNRCSSRCRHCSALPGMRKGVLSIDDIRRTIDVATENYDIESVMAFGGEPLLYPDSTCFAFEYAASKGVPVRQIITNGYWTSDKERIKDICTRLKKSGVNDVLLSVDYFHQEFLNFEIIEYSVETLSALDFQRIHLHPCWYESAIAGNEYDTITRDYLDRLKKYGLPVSDGNVVFPSGNASINFKGRFLPLNHPEEIRCGSMPYSENPVMVRTLTLGPDATVGVCGLEPMRAVEFVQHYNPYSDGLLKIFLDHGIQSLMEKAKDNKIHFEVSDYFSPCEACTALRERMKNHL